MKTNYNNLTLKYILFFFKKKKKVKVKVKEYIWEYSPPIFILLKSTENKILSHIFKQEIGGFYSHLLFLFISKHFKKTTKFK